MSITAYSILESPTAAGLNTLVAAAIAGGQQPQGVPFVVVHSYGPAYCQLVITGSQVLVGATGADAVGSIVTCRHAAGVPVGAPTGNEGPVAIDSTAVTGGLYVWTGAAWVKGATIP